MPLRTETIHFDAERDRLTEQMEDLAERQANWQDRDENRARELLRQGNALENQREVLAHLAEEWDRESVTLAGLTTGEVNLVEDTADKHDNVRERDAWVAIGTHDAPYLEHDPEDYTIDAYEDTVLAVADLPLPYVRWAEAKIADLSHLGADEGNGYLALVRDKLET